MATTPQVATLGVPAPAGRWRTRGLQLFASTRDETRSRRPTDVALAIVSTLAVVVAGVLSTVLVDIDGQIAGTLAGFRGFLDALWRLAFWAPAAWAAALVGAATVRRRPALARDLFGAAVVAATLAALTAAIVGGAGDRGTAELLLDVDGPPAFPPGVLVVATAIVSTCSPHVSRPFRHLGRWLILFQLSGTLLLGAAVPTGATAGVAVGTLATALVHLAVGSPGGRPTTSRIRHALADLGLQVDDLQPASMQPHGVVFFQGRDTDGDVLVKVYGRDAWDAQLLANLWRLAWYRGTDRTARLSRLELVEHEGFVTLLAERIGAQVPRLLTAGSAGRGDALVVVRPLGETLAARRRTADWPQVTSETGVTSLWGAIERLHDAGISHGRIDLDRVVITSAGTLALGDLSSASVAGELEDVLADRAQLLALSLLALGETPAVEVGRRALGDEALVAALPYLQEAAMPPLIRSELDHRHLELDEARRRMGTQLGAPDQSLIELRRVTLGSLLNLALLGIAAFTLIGLLGDLDLGAFVDGLADANWWWLGFALVLAQLPRIPSAISTMGATTQPLPLGPLTTLQFAICYVNLAIPSTAARIAINIRFFQRFGVFPAAAISASVIDSVSGFVVQIALFLLLFFGSDLELELSTDTDRLDGLLTIVLVIVCAMVVAAIVLSLFPAVRNRAGKAFGQVRASLIVLRSPVKLLQSLGGNLLSQVGFAIALGACVRAFGADLPLSSLVLINTVVSLFAGMLPVPGGIGVSEAGLSLGLTTAGLSTEVAFAATLAYRFASFYLPPVWGYACYRWLVRRRFL